jgi:hypothetical protein
MAAIVNGLSLSKLRAFGATFFIFSDYARPAIRLSALMELPAIFVFTHDAMGDGEDGPTHQPVEHLASLRAIPGLVTLRPGDANEVVEAYRCIMQLRHQPAVLALSATPPTWIGKIPRLRVPRRFTCWPTPKETRGDHSTAAKSAWPRPTRALARASAPGCLDVAPGNLRSSDENTGKCVATRRTAAW